MTIASMTGFSRAQGVHGVWSYAWEVKSVNAKGLDLRLRLPPGFDAVEVKARRIISEKLARGACSAALSVSRASAAGALRINRSALEALLRALESIPLNANLRSASLDGLLALRGVVEFVEPEDDETERAELEVGIMRCLGEALDALVASRREEGKALSIVLCKRLDRLEEFARRADMSPARQPEAARARLAQQLSVILEASSGLDPLWLHREAALLVVKSDIREEIDRLHTHLASARALLAAGGPMGRRLDFLAQELAREANTLCAKVNDASLTAIGLDMKFEIEQWREQVQNLE
ncbi:MAG TPA: YicC/YloC family endoribonuclease [Methylocystis sp.]|nr:YicC/YloC family endoribonuclease [Methylocystis sp.]